MLSLFVTAHELPVENKPRSISATHYLESFDVAAYLQTLEQENPSRYNELKRLEAEQKRFNKLSTQQQMFWALDLTDLTDPEFYQTTATLRISSGDSVRIWVEDESWNNGYVDNAVLNTLIAGLVNGTPPGSIDPSQGILNITGQNFGGRPDKAGDGYLNFLILDIKDTFDPDGNRAFVGGYFFPYDQSNESMSNRQDLLYLDSFPGIFSPFTQELRTESVLATTAHEVQHLIHFNYDTDEETWLNEAMSELASFLCGYTPGSPALYLGQPDRSLTAWDNELRDYSRVGLWSVYLFEQFGLDFIRTLTQDTRSGISGLNTLLQSRSTDFDETFRNFAIANIVNNSQADPRFGYLDDAYRGLSAEVSETIFTFPQLVEANYDALGVSYFRLSGDGLLTLSFSSTIDNALLLRESDTTVEVTELFGDSIAFNNFNPDDEFYLVVYGNTAGSRGICAWAEQSLAEQSDVYDTGNLDLRINGALGVANRFRKPSGFDLSEISFQNTTTGQLSIRFYRDGGGRPGSTIGAAIDTLIENDNSVVSIIPPEDVINGLSAGEVFYVSVAAGNTDFAYAYEDAGFDNSNSFILRNASEGWQNLSNFQVDGNRLAGNWMIRAFYTGGLVNSGSPNCIKEEFDGNFKLMNLYPNPTSGNVNIPMELSGTGVLKMRVFNVLGQEVLKNNYQLNGIGKVREISLPVNKQQDSNALPPGVYFVRASFTNETDGKTTFSNTKKFIVLEN